MNVSVLGAGSWGTTLAIVLDNNGHNTTLWEYKRSYAKKLQKTRVNDIYLPKVKLSESIKITHSIDEAVNNQHLIVIAVPTQFVRSVLMKIKNADLKNTILVSVSKGIEVGTLLTVSGIIKDVLKNINKSNVGVLSGPSHAEEVSRKLPTAVVSASEDLKTAEIIQAAFTNSYFRVYASEDLIGVELGGAFKNVIAIGAGIIDGADFGDNTKAAIMTRAIVEISRLGIAMGAKRETFAGLSGMGDLIVTCMSRHSRNRYVGEQIGKGKKLKDVIKSMDMVAEGVETCKSVNKLAEKYTVDVPISNSVYKILFGKADPQMVTYELMTREVGTEY